jgi:hypothetical protein
MTVLNLLLATALVVASASKPGVGYPKNSMTKLTDVQTPVNDIGLSAGDVQTLSVLEGVAEAMVDLTLPNMSDTTVVGDEAAVVDDITNNPDEVGDIADEFYIAYPSLAMAAANPAFAKAAIMAMCESDPEACAVMEEGMVPANETQTDPNFNADALDNFMGEYQAVLDESEENMSVPVLLQVGSTSNSGGVTHVAMVAGLMCIVGIALVAVQMQRGGYRKIQSNAQHPKFAMV